MKKTPEETLKDFYNKASSCGIRISDAHYKQAVKQIYRLRFENAVCKVAIIITGAIALISILN